MMNNALGGVYSHTWTNANGICSSYYFLKEIIYEGFTCIIIYAHLDIAYERDIQQCEFEKIQKADVIFSRTVS